jgi:DNA-binding response OmpR family regulator
MVVDDEYDTAYFFKVTLEEHGFLVDMFTNPVTALSKYKRNVYDLLIIDIRMPQMNGFQLFEKIKSVDPSQKVCFVTAFETYYDSLRESFPNLDVECFIRKPITKDHLLARVTARLSVSY